MFTITPHPVVPADGPERSGLARLWYQLGPGSRRRHARARAEAQRLTLLQERWQQACHHIGLGLMIYTPSGVVVAVPRVARADFSPPVSFTVSLRPGQGAADLEAAAPRLARALGVAGLRVDELAAGWVNVVVVEAWDAVDLGVDRGNRGNRGYGGVGNDRPDDGPWPPERRVA